MRVLITGATGFLGRALTAIAEAEGHEVVGTSRSGRGGAVAVDLIDADAARQLVDAGFDIAFHLAFANASADRLGDATIMTAIRGTANLFDALCAQTRVPRTLLVSSSAVYGRSTQRAPFAEDEMPQPVTLYGILKLAQENLARSYRNELGLPLAVVRPFNLVGPGDGGRSVIAAVARQIVARERGTAFGPVRTGFLGGYRDFVDVRDAAHACWLVGMRWREGGTYNIASGQAVRALDLIPLMLRCTSVKVDLEAESSPRPFDVPYSCGDSSRLREHTGWTPEFSLERSLEDTFAHLRLQAAPPPSQE